MRRTSFVLASLAMACSGEGNLPRCDGDASCATGQVCYVAKAGEKGVCVAPFTIALAAPAANAWVNAAGVTVRASLKVEVPAYAAPATIELRADGQKVVDLVRGSESAEVWTYAEAWAPPAGSAQDVTLTAAAPIAGRGEVVSAPIAVRVDVALPSVAVTEVSCATAPCLRNGTLTVKATADDPNLASVAASLDLDGHVKTVALAKVGSGYQGTLDLTGWPFHALERTSVGVGPVVVAVAAADLAGNQREATASVDVTRVQWTYDAVDGVTSPAVMADGTLVVGVDAGTDQLRALYPLTGVDPGSSQAKWKLTMKASDIAIARPVKIPPSVGSSIYAGSTDNRVYAVSQDGMTILNSDSDGAGCGVVLTVKGPPTVASYNSTELALSASGDGSSGYLALVGTGPKCNLSPSLESFGTSLVVDTVDTLRALTERANLEEFTFNDKAISTQLWTPIPSVGTTASAPIALGTGGIAWTASSDTTSSRLAATDANGQPRASFALPNSASGSPVVLANGDVVVGDASRVVHRVSPAGVLVWSSPELEGNPLAPLVLAGGEAMLLVPTTTGRVYALGPDGAVIWKGVLSPGQALDDGNIRALPGSPYSLAYFGGAAGKVYAVLIEGHLDTSAPWPKAFHDTRNTSNAASPLP